MKKSIILGRASDKNLITLEMEIKERKSINFKTMNEENFKVLSISGYAQERTTSDYSYCGQIYDEVLKEINNLKRVEKSKIKRIIEIWKQYHLNDLKAGTIKQENYIKELKNNGFKYDYSKALEELRKINLDIDNGYKYGSSWLAEVIPDNILIEIKELFN